MSWRFALEVWRVAAIAGGMVIAAFATVVVARYLILGGQEAHQSPHRGHVVTVAASYAILVAVAAGEQAARFDQPLSWRLPFVTVAFALGAYALHVVWRHLR